MEKDQLAFTCPRCRVNLVVPASVAGVEGPCPKCGGTIRAPHRSAKPADPLVKLDVRDESSTKARPVGNFQPVAQQSFVESTAMISKKKARRRLLFLTIAIFLCFAGVLAWFFAEQLGRKQPPPPVRNEVKTPPVAQVKEPEAEAPKVDPLEDPRVPPEGLDVHEFVKKSAGVLGKFLVAPGLEERLPLLETTIPKEQLAETVLAAALPSTGIFESLEVKFDKVQGANEVIFKCEFTDPGGVKNNHLVLVRTRGTQEPKVVAEPFLDTYGGRLAAFAKAPHEGSSKFRIVGTFFDFCSDEAVPDHTQKCTMKVSSAPGTPDIAKAYFAKSSPLREKLERLKVRFGHGSGVTVTLRWNTTSKPFLEVADVVSLDWDN